MHSLRKSHINRIILLTAIINIATNMVHPVTPTLMEERGYADAMFGILFAAMSVGSLLFGPLWGRLSDRMGRVKPLMLATGGYALAQLGFCYCTDPVLAVCIRFVGGSFAIATTALPIAYAVDVSAEESRSKNLSLLAAAVTLGASLGYFLGGVVGILSVEAAFLAQCAMLVGCIGAMYMTLGESKAPEAALSVEKAEKKRSGLAASRALLTPSMLVFLLGVAFAVFSTTGYDNALNYYFRDQMRFDSWVNGVLRGVAGLLGLSVNLWVNPWIARKFPSHKALACSLSAGAACVCVMIAMPHLALFLLMKFLCDGFNAMYPPMQQVAVAENQKQDFGLLSGLFTSARSVGMVSGSLAAGFIYEIGPKLPFYAQGVGLILSAACVLIAFSMRRQEKT